MIVVVESAGDEMIDVLVLGIEVEDDRMWND